jgi:hypothetical protein
MILEDVVGITDLDGEAVVDEAELPTPLRLLLRKILLQYIRLSDGHQLLVEIHQSGGVMGIVQAVVPNTPEAEQMILMINKNFPAYVGYVLHGQGLPDGFLMELFRCTCCPTMFSEMASCTWDPDSGTLTTACKADKRKNLAELEKASWYKNAFEDIGTVKRSNPNPPPELLFNLDEDRSIKTIHLRNEARLSLKEGGSQPLQKKLIDKVVQPMSSDEESASSSRNEGLRSAAANGVEYSPSSSAEDNGQAPDATNGR